jgi:hypothetical protein
VVFSPDRRSAKPSGSRRSATSRSRWSSIESQFNQTATRWSEAKSAPRRRGRRGASKSIRLRGEALSRNPALIQYEYVQKITPGVQTIITDGRSILSLGDLVKPAQGRAKQ